MEAISNFVSEINGLVWGPPMLVMILGVGLFLSIGLKLMRIMKLGAGFRLMFVPFVLQNIAGAIGCYIQSLRISSHFYLFLHTSRV